MLLSVIIVNYNVKYFLEQCLFSLRPALENLDAEIIVADNNSVDGSIKYLEPAFPEVSFVKNATNVGFAKANNQAFERAKGKHILFLNPDTLISVDTIKKSLDFLSEREDAGALGIRMIDGSGNFLPESKRSFPSPFTSLFKLSGLAEIFPHSQLFARYHLGHLPQHLNHEVDVLAGAFMLIKKEVLDAVGCFDEAFFMYGEDIDLSFRIQKAGWKNWYFSGSTIIHFKGESTKKGSLNYVRMFYQAMNLFVQKHYSGGRAGIFNFFISVAIWVKAFISASGRFVRWIGLPVFDIFITLSAIGVVSTFWQSYIKPGIQYPAKALWTIVPLFTLVFILAGAFAGLYDKWYSPIKAFVAMMLAVIFNLAVYSLFDIDYRFSRGVILFGGILASSGILLLRFILVKTGVLDASDEKKEHRQTLVCGSGYAFEKVVTLMKLAGRDERILGHVSVHEAGENSTDPLNSLGTFLKTVPAREIVFCIDEENTLEDAMAFIQKEKRHFRYKFFYKDSGSIIGSGNKQTTGETLSGVEIFSIENPENKRYKRMVDVSIALLGLALLPLNIFIVKKPLVFIENIFQVLAGNKTWVTYCDTPNFYPDLPEGVLGNNSLAVNRQPRYNESLQQMDYWYAKDYYWLNDVRIILKGYRFLGS